MPTSEISAETQTKTDLIILIAWKGDSACGYKVGFQHSTKRFYSWIGGVHPDHREQGIARRLMETQHQIAKSLGYQYVFTNTENRYRGMLLLNIKMGFDVIGIRNSLGAKAHAIILEKALD